MTCFLTCMFTLLQICLVPSKAMLFPPENLTVGLLDFKATAEWLRGQGNPPGTKYSLEFITARKMLTGKWIQSPHCTNITILKCELTFDPQPDELFWNYFVRVKTTFRGTSSTWRKTSKSFQPYGDTRLSSPNLTISTDQKSIHITFSHWLESKPGIRPLEFLLHLCGESPESKCVPISTSKSPYIFPDVPSGNYCVSVSASHQLASKSNNFNTTKCILLDSSRSSVLMVCIAAVLLIVFSTGIVVIFVCFYDMRLIIRKLSIPDALIIFPGNNWVLKLIPEEFQKIIQTWQKPLTYKEDGVSVSEEDSEDGSHFYHQRENLLEQVEEAETSDQCYKYTPATNLEFIEESVISEKDDDDDNDDDMHPVTPASLCTCTSESSKFLQATTVNTFVNSEMDRYCAEETPCSSGNDCESEAPTEEKEEEEDDVSLLAYYSSENGYEYEPRHDIINKLEVTFGITNRLPTP